LQDYNPFLGRVYVPQFKKAQIVISEALRTRLLPVVPDVSNETA